MSSIKSQPSVTAELPDPRPGSVPVRFGKYTLVERLGRGGMAEVWKARMLGPAGFQRTLVVKRILPHLVEDPHFIDMFTAEARLSARLNHANIVQVFELGDVGGEYYLAMEYVRGRDLVNVMRSQLLRGRPDPGMGAYAMREVCRALAYAHALTDDDGRPLKLIHRDVSPSNVMLSFDGAVKLLDFGIAKALAEANENKTQTGTLKGKFGYMAPEQVEGRTFDHRSDLFAAGIVLHETLTGRRLFKGAGDLQTIAMVREAKVEPPSFLNPEVPHELDRITLKALARDPADRYASGEEMAADLDRVAHQLNWGPERLQVLMHELFADEPIDTNAHDLPPEAHASVGALATIARRKRLRVIAVSTLGALTLMGGAFALVDRARQEKVVSATAPALAPAPAPPPPAAPTPSTEVKLRVRSEPSGATVRFEGDEQPLGKTPLELKVPRADEPRLLLFALDGYKETSLEVIPDSDQTASAVMSPMPAKPAPRPARVERPKRSPPRKTVEAAKTKPKASSPDLKRGDVVDPFAR